MMAGCYWGQRNLPSRFSTFSLLLLSTHVAASALTKCVFQTCLSWWIGRWNGVCVCVWEHIRYLCEQGDWQVSVSKEWHRIVTPVEVLACVAVVLFWMWTPPHCLKALSICAKIYTGCHEVSPSTSKYIYLITALTRWIFPCCASLLCNLWGKYGTFHVFYGCS